LPEYADDMVKGYLSEHEPPVVSALDRPFQALALRRIRTTSRPDPELLKPALLRRLG